MLLVLEQVRPSIVLLSADVDDLRCEIEKFYKGRHLISILLCIDASWTVIGRVFYLDERLEPARIETMPRKAFAYEAGKANLTTWHIQNSSSILRQSFTASSYTDTTSNMQLDNLPSRMYCEDPLDGRRRQAYLELSCMVLFDNLISVSLHSDRNMLSQVKLKCSSRLAAQERSWSSLTSWKWFAKTVSERKIAFVLCICVNSLGKRYPFVSTNYKPLNSVLT